MLQGWRTEEDLIMTTTQTHMDTTPQLPVRIGGVNVANLYRAVVGAADYSNIERITFVEAANHQSAIGTIAAAVAALENRAPAKVAERVYNCESARELVERGESENLVLRLFETGWSGDRPTYVREPLFLLDGAAALIREWSAIPAADKPGPSRSLRSRCGVAGHGL